VLNLSAEHGLDLTNELFDLYLKGDGASWMEKASKDTKPETILRSALWTKGIRGYRLHWKRIPGSPDIAYMSKKVAVFVNGCYWHRCPHCKPHFPRTNASFWNNKFIANIERDKRKNDELAQLVGE
jgi:DNA mismatch endonuclease (patch repair protein)